MKHNIIVCLVIVASLATALATVQQVEAQSTKAHVPTVTLNIRYNPANGHNYFDPTYPCIRGNVADVVIKNTTHIDQTVQWWDAQHALLHRLVLRAGQQNSVVEHAYNMNPDNADEMEIDVVLNPQLWPNERIAVIYADGVGKSCIA